MRIAITGIGAVSALGIGVEAHRKALLTGNSALRSARHLPTVHSEWQVGEVDLDNKALRQLAKCEALNGDVPVSRNTLLALVAAREALADANLTATSNMALCSGTTVGGMDLTEEVFAQWTAGNTSSLGIIAQHEAHASTTFMAQALGGFAYTTTPSTACSSALNAMIQGAEMLLLGECQQVMVGGTESLTRFHLNGFASLGILSPDRCRPFQPDRNGINLGEGAAYLVMETEASAQARGAHIYAYLSGFANRCDAFHQTASSDNGEGAFLAMKAALAMAQLKPENIDYINAHGTGTENNDASESAAIARIFGTSPLAATMQRPVVESTKPLTGHTTSASGSLEAIFSLLRMEARGYQCVMSNAFGFGGNDSSIVLTAKPVDINVSDNAYDNANKEAALPTVSPMALRRLTPQMKQLVKTALDTLTQAAVTQPDAIIVGTRWGCLLPSVKLLHTLMEEGEANFSPSLFMQSTHNTPASTLALLLHCHSYNLTLSSGSDSLAQARDEANRLIRLGMARHVLVCAYDEPVDEWDSWTRMQGVNTPSEVVTELIVKQ